MFKKFFNKYSAQIKECIIPSTRDWSSSHIKIRFGRCFCLAISMLATFISRFLCPTWVTNAFTTFTMLISAWAVH